MYVHTYIHTQMYVHTYIHTHMCMYIGGLYVCIYAPWTPAVATGAGCGGGSLHRESVSRPGYS